MTKFIIAHPNYFVYDLLVAPASTSMVSALQVLL